MGGLFLLSFSPFRVDIQNVSVPFGFFTDAFSALTLDDISEPNACSLILRVSSFKFLGGRDGFLCVPDNVALNAGWAVIGAAVLICLSDVCSNFAFVKVAPL